MPTYLSQLLYLYSLCWSSLDIITSIISLGGSSLWCSILWQKLLFLWGQILQNCQNYCAGRASTAAVLTNCYVRRFVPMSLYQSNFWLQDLNSQPPNPESPPVTTRPLADALCKQILKYHSCTILNLSKFGNWLKTSCVTCNSQSLCFI